MIHVLKLWVIKLLFLRWIDGMCAILENGDFNQIDCALFVFKCGKYCSNVSGKYLTCNNRSEIIWKGMRFIDRSSVTYMQFMLQLGISFSFTYSSTFVWAHLFMMIKLWSEMKWKLILHNNTRTHTHTFMWRSHVNLPSILSDITNYTYRIKYYFMVSIP